MISFFLINLSLNEMSLLLGKGDVYRAISQSCTDEHSNRILPVHLHDIIGGYFGLVVSCQKSLPHWPCRELTHC